MSRLGDYRSRMTLSQFADEEIEQLISHQVATDPELAALAGLLTDFRSQNLTEPSPAAVERLARSAASVVRSIPEPVRPAAPGRKRSLLKVLRTSPATAVSILALMIFSGLGLTANAAVPGDLLYGLDMAMETVGIGAGSLPERISEGQALADRGQHLAAADHLETSISIYGQQASVVDLARAFDALDEYEGLVNDKVTPDGTPPPANENAGPGNNNAGGNSETNENMGPGNNNAGGNSQTPDGTPPAVNENMGPGNNNAGGNSETNENAGPGNNNAGGNSQPPDGTPPPVNENMGPGNNAGGNSETNENAGPGNNNAGGSGKGGN